MTKVEGRTKLLRRAPYLGYVLLFLAGVIAAVVGDRGYLDVMRLRAERARAAEDLAGFRARVESERQAVARLSHDTLTRERIAREKLGLVEPGEVLILLSDDPRAESAPRQPLPPPPRRSTQRAP